MTKFDEAPSDDGRGWLGPICRQPGVFVASAVAIAIAIAVAGACLFGVQAGRAQVARMAAGTQFAVVLGPEVTRIAAEAMRGRLESLPLIGAATLQTREQALARLPVIPTSAGGSPTIPLPDVWLLTVREPGTDGAMKSFADDRARLQQTLAALPGVASVRVDADWGAFVDRWISTVLDALPVVQRSTLGVLAAIVFCLAFVAVHADRDGADRKAHGGAGPAILSGLIACVFGFCMAAGVAVAGWNLAGGPAIEWPGFRTALSASLEAPVAWLVATAVIASALGSLAGSTR